MLDNNEEIIFENILGEPESTRPDDIILGDIKIGDEGRTECTSDSDCLLYCGGHCASNCTNYGTGSTTYYFTYYVGFEIDLIGKYSVQSSTWYPLKYNGSGAIQTSQNNVTFPFYYMGYNYIKERLTSAQPFTTIRVLKSGKTTFRGTSTKNAYICGVTVSTKGSIGANGITGLVTTGRIKYLVSNTHAARTYVPISAVVAVVRFSNSTAILSNANELIFGTSAHTDISVFEKPLILTAVDNDNVRQRLQGATITLTSNSGGIHSNTNVFETGSYGYIRLFTSGNNASQYTATISRPGYETKSVLGSYYNSSANPVNNINDINMNVQMVKNDYLAPNTTRLQSNLLHEISVGDFQCRTGQQLLNDYHLSAITGNIILSPIPCTTNQVLRYVDIKSFLNSPTTYYDELDNGREISYTYNPGAKTITRTTVTQLFSPFTGTSNYWLLRLQQPTIYISAATSNINTADLVLQLFINNEYTHYYKIPITAQYMTAQASTSYIQWTSTDEAWTSPKTNYISTAALKAVFSRDDGGSVQATGKTISSTYWYSIQTINEGGIPSPPGGDEN